MPLNRISGATPTSVHGLEGAVNTPYQHTHLNQKSAGDIKPKTDWCLVAINGAGIATAYPAILDGEYAKAKRYRCTENQIERHGCLSMKSTVSCQDCQDNEGNVSEYHAALGFAVHIVHRQMTQC